MTLHVHIADSPCMGKSMIAAQVFAKLRMMGINAELVQKYAKKNFWERSFSNSSRFLTVTEVIEFLRLHADRLYCLRVNQTGEPRHPLYIAADTELTLFLANTE